MTKTSLFESVLTLIVFFLVIYTKVTEYILTSLIMNNINLIEAYLIIIIPHTQKSEPYSLHISFSRDAYIIFNNR